MKHAISAFLLGAMCVVVPLGAVAGELPSQLAPAQPFPRIFEQAPTIEGVAPGIEYGDYQLITELGPLSIHVVEVDPHRSDVRVSGVLAYNALQSKGETVGSMAKRTGAVAGINGDYFDIGNTNRPLNIVVRNGTLLQVPRKRYALAITRDGLPQITEFNFAGEVVVGDRTLTLDGIDELPPPNAGTSLLTPEFGNVSPEVDLTLVALQVLDGTPPLARFRVTSIADNLSPQQAGYYLAIGSSAYGLIDVPSPGDIITSSGDLAPLGLESLAAAIGGGPLILHHGVWYDDPDGPSGREYAKRIPCTGAAIAPDGRLYLIEVDGRQPSVSIGLTRREFAALMRALGASEGLAFDGGGSSTIVVRRLGDPESAVANDPSDGRERPVANGLFVYSTAPVGPAVRLVARPGTIHAVTGAEIPLRIAAVDAANHVAAGDARLTARVEPPTLGIFRNGRFTALLPGAGHIVMQSGRMRGAVSVVVQKTPALLRIAPGQPNVERGGTIALKARAFDSHGFPLTLPQLLPWETKGGSIDAYGRYHAASHDADVGLRIGDAMATTRVTVGSHEVAMPFSDRAHFMTLPHGGSGKLSRDQQCRSCVQLAYSFGSNERAAYAVADLPLPQGSIGLSFDVLDDGSAARLRVALRNSINEEVLADATPLDRPGWRHVVVRFSPDTGPAARLIAIYVLPPKGMQLAEGQIILRDVRAVVAGQ